MCQGKGKIKVMNVTEKFLKLKLKLNVNVLKLNFNVLKFD
jgi:hypothetical protein